MSRTITLAAGAVCAALFQLSIALAQDRPPPASAPTSPPAAASPPAPSKPPAAVPAPPPRSDVTPLPRGESGGGVVRGPGAPPPRAANPRPQPSPNIRDGNRYNRGDEWRRSDRRYYDRRDRYYGPPGFSFGFGVPGPGYYEYDDEPQQCGWIHERTWRGDRWIVRRVWRCWDN